MGFGGQPSPAASQRAKAGSGGGSCTHGGEAYEAHLNLILPAVKLVESVGNAPTSTCLQGRCIPCLPRPQRKTGKSPWCCPRQAEFWKLCCTSWCATCEN